VELLGFFTLTGPVTDEDKKDIHVQTYQQLFPYAEVLTKQVCAAGGMPNFVLLRHKMDRDKVSLNKKQ
jgi:preprotein translocase subunit SecB